jgi:hypothetical protein
MLRSRLSIVLLSLTLPMSAGASDAYPETDATILSDYAELTAGVALTDLGSGPAPGTLVVHGRSAFPVVLDEGEQVFVGAARQGAGRSLAFGHGAYFGGPLTNGSDLGLLVTNGVSWAAARPNPQVGVEPGQDALASFLADQGFTVSRIGPTEVATVDVFCVSAQTAYDPAELDAVRAWVDGGGGLLTAGTPWAFSYEDFAVNFPGNRMLCGSGLTFNGNYTWPSAGEDAVSAEPACPLLNATRAADALQEHVDGAITLPLADQARASATIRAAMNVLEQTCTDFWTALDELLARLGPVFPTEADPVDVDAEPLDALVVNHDDWVNQNSPPEEITAHPAADDFPGAVPPSAPVVERTLTIDGDFEGLPDQRLYAGAGAAGWRSTGLYAPPGALIEIDVPAERTGDGLSLLIGCHSDTLFNKDSWVRSPRVTRSFPLEAVTTRAANGFGGLVFVRVPRGSMLGSFDVTIRGAVEAPLYEHGLTDLADWVATVRDLEAPWAELASDRFIMSVPSADIRTLDDPVDVMELWNAILDADADLAAIPRQRGRAERFVFDRQISAGWMHSGYPIMAHLVSTSELLDTAATRAGGAWGPLHELGHDHQWRDWVIPNTTESSCNLWSIYASEEVLGIDRGLAHGAVEPSARRQRLDDYVAAGADASAWGAWEGLEFYLLVQEGFGWQPYIDVFGEYLTIPEPERPGNAQERIDQWLVRQSRSVNRDLRDYFDCWGLTTTEPSRSDVSSLPTWERDPMRRYCPSSFAALVINRLPQGAAEVLPPAFDGVCSTLPHRLCEEERVDGDLDGLLMPDELLPTGLDGLVLYEHSGGLQDMRLGRVGDDLVFSVP